MPHPDERRRAEPVVPLDQVIAAVDESLRRTEDLIVQIGVRVDQLRSRRSVVDDLGEHPRDEPGGQGD